MSDEDIAVDGSITSTGTFKFISATTADVVVNTQSQMTITGVNTDA